MFARLQPFGQITYGNLFTFFVVTMPNPAFFVEALLASAHISEPTRAALLARLAAPAAYIP